MGYVHDSTEQATLLEHLATIPDPRSARGRRYEWLYLLTLMTMAMMTGESTLVGISHWVRAHEQDLIGWLQPRCQRVPSLSTLRRVLTAVSIEALEAAISAYLQALRPALGESGQIQTLGGEHLQGLAVDGKTVRCATAHGTVTHLSRLSAMRMGSS